MPRIRPPDLVRTLLEERLMALRVTALWQLLSHSDPRVRDVAQQALTHRLTKLREGEAHYQAVLVETQATHETLLTKKRAGHEQLVRLQAQVMPRTSSAKWRFLLQVRSVLDGLIQIERDLTLCHGPRTVARPPTGQRPPLTAARARRRYEQAVGNACATETALADASQRLHLVMEQTAIALARQDEQLQQLAHEFYLGLNPALLPPSHEENAAQCPAIDPGKVESLAASAQTPDNEAALVRAGLAKKLALGRGTPARGDAPGARISLARKLLLREQTAWHRQLNWLRAKQATAMPLALKSHLSEEQVIVKALERVTQLLRPPADPRPQPPFFEAPSPARPKIKLIDTSARPPDNDASLPLRVLTKKLIAFQRGRATAEESVARHKLARETLLREQAAWRKQLSGLQPQQSPTRDSPNQSPSADASVILKGLARATQLLRRHDAPRHRTPSFEGQPPSSTNCEYAEQRAEHFAQRICDTEKELAALRRRDAESQALSALPQEVLPPALSRPVASGRARKRPPEDDADDRAARAHAQAERWLFKY